MDATTALIIVLPIVTALISIASFFLARQKHAHDAGKSEGNIKADIQYIRRMLEDVLLAQRELNRKTDEFAERLTRAEESTRSAHKRLDTHNDQIMDLIQGGK